MKLVLLPIWLIHRWQRDIRDLYLKDADWNIIIPGLNDRTTDEEIAFADLLNEKVSKPE